MEEILNNEVIDDEFIVYMTRLTFKEFRNIFDYEDQKKIRNDYDNRLKGKNLFFYFYFLKNRDQEREIRKLRKMNKLLTKEKAKSMGLNAIGFVVPKSN